ncbi:MAG: BrnT family toxin [Candidatus Brocadiaceae bacterium]|nr:BrnT family toxin [Candidatus Brocadiaceae bacterium]
MSDNKLLFGCIGFDWDKNNSEKIWLKHQVLPSESEQIFFNLPFVLADTEKHSEKSNRYYALGHTDADRKLFVVFTVRASKIRVITARDMSRNERKEYKSHEKENT